MADQADRSPSEKTIHPNVLKMMDGARKYIEESHPLFKKLGLRATKIAFGEVAFNLTIDECFTDIKTVHGGVFTIVLDTIMSYAVYSRLESMTAMATINLKTDYPGQAKPGARIICTAQCDAITDDVAYCQGQARDKETGELIALAEATFMIGTRSKPQGSRL